MWMLYPKDKVYNSGKKRKYIYGESWFGTSSPRKQGLFCWLNLDQKPLFKPATKTISNRFHVMTSSCLWRWLFITTCPCLVACAPVRASRSPSINDNGITTDGIVGAINLYRNLHAKTPSIRASCTWLKTPTNRAVYLRRSINLNWL